MIACFVYLVNTEFTELFIFAIAYPKNQFGPQSQNLASVIRGYKIGVTQFARQHNLPFAWQPRYHDHIIPSADEHARIQRYISTNPQTWEKDSLR